MSRRCRSRPVLIGRRGVLIGRRGALIGRRAGVGVVQRLVGIGDARGLVATALHAKDDEQDPGDQLADGADGHAGDAAVVHARVGARVARAVRAVRAAHARRVGGPRAEDAPADDEEEDGGNEEGDWPPFGELAARWRPGDNGGSRWRVGVCRGLARHFV